MIRRTLDWLNALMGRPSVARRRKSLCAFGDRLEDRSLLSAVLVSIEPGLAEEATSDDAVDTREIISAEEAQREFTEEIFVTDETFGGEEIYETAIDTTGETKSDEWFEDAVDEELPVDAIFYTLFSTSGEVDDVSDMPSDDTQSGEPEQRLTVVEETEPQPSAFPAPTLLVSSNPRQTELVTMLFQSMPVTAPPISNTFAAATSLTSAARLDVLNDSGAVIVGKDVTAKESSKIQPAAAEKVQPAPQLVDPDTAKTRRIEVINSLFNQKVPEPEPRELQVPEPDSESAPTVEEVTPARIAAEDAEDAIPATPRRFLPIEPAEAVEDSTEPVLELKADDPQAVAPLSRGATTIAAAGAMLLSAPHELWRHTRRRLRRMRRHIR